MTRALQEDFGPGLRHSLALASVLIRRILVNRERSAAVAKSLGFPREQVWGAARLLRSLRYVPSPERLALVVMRDPGLDDEDIGEIFGRSAKWAAVVRSQADEIRAEEPIEYELEFLDDGLRPGDPTPDEIVVLAAAERAARAASNGRRTDLEPAAGGYGIRAYTWSGHAFVSRRA